MIAIVKLILMIFLPWIVVFLLLRSRRRYLWLSFSGIFAMQLFAVLPIGYMVVIAASEASQQTTTSNIQMGAIYNQQYRVSQSELHGLSGWKGVDITAGCGSPIYAPFSGIVTYVGLDGYNHAENGILWEQATMLTIQNDNGLELTLLHGAYSVDGGDIITAGQQIGTENSYGWSTGCHSHVILKQNGQTLNFLTWQHKQIQPVRISSGESISGYLSAYGKLPTDATLENRQKWNQIPNDLSQFDAYIAVLDCTKIGATGKLHTNAGTLNILVFDCAGTEDGGADWMVRNNYVAELDYYTWERHPELIGTEAVLVLD